MLVDVRGPSLGVEDPDTLEDGVDEPAVPFLGFAELRLRTPQPEQRLDRRQQLVRIDGMRQITIGATLQAVHLVAGGTIGRGEVEHGNRGRPAVGLESSAHLEAVDVGQHHIEENEVGALLGAVQRFAARGGALDLEPGALQLQGRESSDVVVVVHDQDHRSQMLHHFLPLQGGEAHRCSAAVAIVPF